MDTMNSKENRDLSTQPLRVLLIEDDEVDASLVVAMLNKDTRNFLITREANLSSAKQLIDSGDFDVALLDLGLTDSDSINTLDQLDSLAATVATIILTGNSDPAAFHGVIERGAQDCIPKSELPMRLLGRDIEHAVVRHRTKVRLTSEGEQATDASQAKTNFVSAMSHEIRTPLNALLGVSELLENSPLNEEQAEYVRVFRRSGRALLSLINGVLDLASIERGKFELIATHFPVREVAEEVAENFAFTAHKKRLALIVDVDPGVPEIVEGDAERLRQILVNLISNAIKFTQTGHVSLHVHKGGKDTLRFEVLDSGIGVDSQKLATIFEPFEQAKHDPEHVYGGTGLGLALCHGLAQRMGGSIHAEQTDGVGAHMVLRLPLPAQASKDSGLKAGSLGRALVAVSSLKELDAIRRFCNRAGISVDEVTSVSAAQSKLQLASPAYDFLIVDCRVPETGGVSIVESLADLPEKPRSMVLLPMDHRPGDTKLCEKIGASSMIKPVRERRLQEWLLDSEPQGRPIVAAAESFVDRLPPGLKILHADDSADNRLLVDAYLRNSGCEITEVFDGVDAVEKFVSGEFDVVLMDVLMPRMDGLEATRRIREFEEREGKSPTPIVALTANAFSEQIEKCMRAGTSLHIAKPISQQMLFDGLLSVLDFETPEDDVFAPSPSADEALVDLSEIDPDILELLPVYLSRRSDEVGELRSLIAAGDFDPLRVAGHNLKGTGTGYGLPELTQIGGRLEAAAKVNDSDSIGVEIENLDRVVLAALEAVDRLSGANQ